MSHTPAPWHMNQWSDLIRVNNGKAGSSNVTILEYYDGDAKDSEMIANARLIAAAPDLLEALTNLVDAFQKARTVVVKAGQDDDAYYNSFDLYPHFDNACAAIKKATEG